MFSQHRDVNAKSSCLVTYAHPLYQCPSWLKDKLQKLPFLSNILILHIRCDLLIP